MSRRVVKYFCSFTDMSSGTAKIKLAFHLMHHQSCKYLCNKNSESMLFRFLTVCGMYCAPIESIGDAELLIFFAKALSEFCDVLSMICVKGHAILGVVQISYTMDNDCALVTGVSLQ